MSKFEVAKVFNTANRRLGVGTPVNEADSLEPFTVEERFASGYLRLKVDTPAPNSPPTAQPRSRARAEIPDEPK